MYYEICKWSHIHIFSRFSHDSKINSEETTGSKTRDGCTFRPMVVSISPITVLCSFRSRHRHPQRHCGGKKLKEYKMPSAEHSLSAHCPLTHCAYCWKCKRLMTLKPQSQRLDIRCDTVEHFSVISYRHTWEGWDSLAAPRLRLMVAPSGHWAVLGHCDFNTWQRGAIKGSHKVTRGPQPCNALRFCTTATSHNP